MDNPYQILGIDENSSEKEIEKAYKNLSSKVHPDKGGNSYLFNIIKEARNTLLNKDELDEEKLPIMNMKMFSLFDDLLDNHKTFYAENYSYSNINGTIQEDKFINNNGIIHRYTGDGSGKLLRR